MKTPIVRKLRCAVYTRKSSEEGLEQEFNSLDAQRDACEAYVASQKAEGWLLVPDRYDDGGFSGATLERPALRRLIADIEARRVDTVVVYKIDRLSRALMDFAKLVEVFDRSPMTSRSNCAKLSRMFRVSRPIEVVVLKAWVTLTNVTSLRIFQQFSRIGSMTTLLPILAKNGITTKSGKPVEKGYLYRIVNNRVYIGEAVHKGTAYAGEHAAIIDRKLWDRVHGILIQSPRKRAMQSRAQTPALLKGLLFAPDGSAMTPTHTRRKGKLYRYYVSTRILKQAADACSIRRIPAGEIEAAVVHQVRALLRAPEIIVQTWRTARPARDGLTEAEVRDALERFDPLWDELFPAEQARIVRLLVTRIDVSPTGAEIHLRVDGLGRLVRDLHAGPGVQEAA